ncbi:MAG: GWxTD domain-containing protein [Bacteroidota bacterium]|nr:GWxTD domain-containing protein [Bacteroidota bacterium]
MTLRIVLGMVSCWISLAVSQEMVQRERTFSEPIFFETHILFSTNDSNTVYALYRLRQDIFTFTKPFESVTGQFSANGRVTIEILDSTGESITRDIRELPLTSEDNSATFLRTKYVQGRMAFKLKTGTYTVLLSIEDKDAKRQLPEVKRKLNVHKTVNNILSTVVPVQLPTRENTFECFNLNGDVQFSKDCGFLVAVKSIPAQQIRYTLKKINPEEEEKKETVVKDTVVTAMLFPASTFTFSEKNNGVSSEISQSDSSTVIFIPVKISRLKQGRYEINAVLSDSTKLSTTFGTRWLDMPLTLTDLDIATLPLQFIMTQDEYSQIRKGNREERIQRFESFWQKKDPTPETAYNEMMTEFYRRADFAMTAYRTLKEPNGTITDRGKIFILYGKPTSTERILHPGGIPKEIWKYASLNKTFIFEDSSKQGNYKLTESK